MNARLLSFSLCSLCMHFALSWLFLADIFEHGLSDRESVLAVKIVTEDSDQQQVFPREPERIARFLESNSSVGNEPAPISSNTAEITSVPETSVPDASQAVVVQGYVTSGRLTRLPAPLTHIDLNVTEISGLGFAGKAELTILINADGSVAGVIGSTETSDADEFTELVAARFKNALFSPGEIDGKAVKSLLQITVVSENPDATDDGRTSEFVAVHGQRIR